MAKRKKEMEPVAEAVAAPPIQELDTLPGETYGLAVTSPLPGLGGGPAIEPEPVADIGDSLARVDDAQPVEAPPVVAADISSDPNTSVASTLIALGRLHNDAGTASVALATWLRTTAGEPELHAFLMRMQGLIGDFRHSFEQIDQGMSDRLRDAINDALAA